MSALPLNSNNISCSSTQALDSTDYFQYYQLGVGYPSQLGVSQSNWTNWTYYIPNTTVDYIPNTTAGYTLKTGVSEEASKPKDESARSELLDGLLNTFKEVINVITAEEAEEEMLLDGEWDDSFVERSLRDTKAAAYDKIAEIIGGKRGEEKV